MGRKKSYNREEVAERALQAFWEKGYERTSLRDLEAATGVNRYGLYDSFEDKQGLFRECIGHYCATTEAFFEELAPKGFDGLLQLVGRFVDAPPEDNSSRHGCMVITSLLEREGLSSEVQSMLDTHIEALLDYIRGVLTQELRAGTLRADLEIEECVEFVHLALVGLATMSRITTDTSGMQLAAKAALRAMGAWRV